MKTKNLIHAILSVMLLLPAYKGTAQTDTTELSIGKKKLIIIDEKTQKENAVYNLEKGKEYFKEQIAETDKKIAEYEKEKEILKSKLDSIEKIETKTFGSAEASADSSENIKIVAESNSKDDLDRIIEKKINKLIREQEKERLQNEIKNKKLLIEAEKKKREAFEHGIEDIEQGIADIKAGIEDLNQELINQEKKRIKREITGNLGNSSFNAHWAGFEFGLLNFLSAKRTFATSEELDFMVLIPEKTMSYGLNILEYNVKLSESGKIGLVTGGGLEWNSVALRKNVDLYVDEDGILRAEYINPTEIKYEKNKFNAVYVTVPLIIEVQIPVKHRKIYFGAGITGGVRAWSKQKQKFTLNGQKYKNKKVDDFNLSSFRYGGVAELGYGDIGIYVNYGFSPFFKENTGPEIFPFSVGIKIVDF